MYIDLHCDALTREGVLQVTKSRLRAGGCALQCFAAFVGGGGRARFLSLADKFDALCKEEGYSKYPVPSAASSGAAQCDGTAPALPPEGGTAAMLTVEGDALEGELSRLDVLRARGVRVAGFVWNTPTSLGFPNFPDYAGLCAGRVSPYLREERRGLTAFGFAAAERMAELGILADVSHGSDKLFYDVASFRRPFLATHTGAAEVCPWARNLTRHEIKTLADCGGVAGLCFCADFLSPDASAAGQRAALLAHAKAFLDAGGEDVLAIGSDFDGTAPNAYLPDPSYMPRFLEELSAAIGPRAAEKAAFRNAMRVLEGTG